MSRFFIDRPNFAWVVAIFISLAGLLAIPSLPVEKYPQVAPPQITIYANYPGASAEVINDSVTSVIEQEINGAKGLLYFEAGSSSNGTAEMTVTFEQGTDPDLAQVDVQNRLKRAEARLPEVVTRNGLQVEQATSGFLMIYNIVYKPGVAEKDPVRLNDFAARTINNEIRRIPGVGRVQFFGAEPAMRVWVDPGALVGYGLSIQDVNAAIAAQNIQVPAGSFGEPPSAAGQEVAGNLIVRGVLETPEEFGRIVLRANTDGSMVRLSDVARMELGLEDYRFAVDSKSGVAASAAVQLAPGGNALETAQAIKNRLEELSHAFPEDMTYEIGFDTSKFVGVAIKRVVATLLEAIVLVVLVMLLFLQNLRYTLVPTIVVPVCLLGTFAVMSVLGFSINMMTMFGMVLAIGILVDDAIVVVENVERLMAEENLSPRDAAIKAMQQVGGAIVGITLVLTAVFLPLAFMSGSVGVIYRQFSISLAVSILFSGFLALTMTPALCATLLKPIENGHHRKRGFFGWFNRGFAGLAGRYDWLNKRLARRTGRTMAIYAVLVAVLVGAFLRLPEAFVPQEDEGWMIVDIQLPPGASYSRTDRATGEIMAFFASRPEIENTTMVRGFSFSGMGSNAAIAFPNLTDWSERGKGESSTDVIGRVNAFLSGITDATALAIAPPPVDGLGSSSGFALRLQDRGNLGCEKLTGALNELLAKANASPVFAYVMQEGLGDAQEMRLDVDREKAQALGVTFDRVADAISTTFGSAMINEFVNEGRMQRVVVQGSAEARVTPEKLRDVHVVNHAGEQVPLTSFTTTAWQTGPVQISRYNGYPAFKVGGEAAPGYSSGEALAEMERMIRELPEGIGFEWTALSFEEKAAGAQAPMLLGLALLVVFLILVALYESWSIPLSVMLIVPVGAIGAVAAVTLAGMPNDVYFKVGLITIIGLAAKNAILIVEFAKDLHSEGLSIVEAAIQAAHLRFRPIIMTSLAFILGVVPLALASGAGAASQNAIGMGVIGGMLAATILGVMFVPVFYIWVLSLVERRRKPSISVQAEVEP